MIKNTVILKRDEIPDLALEGRGLRIAVGYDGVSKSESMRVLVARYAEKYGNMKPHKHDEETVYILDVQNGTMEYGPQENALTHEIRLEKDMVLHIPKDEWHVFRYKKGGYIEALCIYGAPSQ